MNLWLVIGGVLSTLASLLHLAVIVGGPDWYRFFGAGEKLAQAAARGSPTPAIITIGIASVLAIWAAYAFSGAGLIPRLPLLRTGLVTISIIYLARGMFLAPGIYLGHPFTIWSSAIVLVYGAAYAVGTWQAWPSLGRAA